MVTAKALLDKVRKYDRQIENKTLERQQWEEIATGITAQMGGERVQSSGNQQKMAVAVEKCIDIDREINELIAAKKDIVSILEQLKAAEYDVLYKVYVQYSTLKEVAQLCDRSYSWAVHTHIRALRNLQAILDAKEKER